MEGPIVTIASGKLQGKINKNIYNGDYYSFQGIPYAKPPIGHLRFKAPQPVELWTGILDATKNGTECFSRHHVLRTLIGGEDCLILNVFTRNIPKTKDLLRPVMFWIHGGSFTSGSSNSEVYGPEFLLTEDVVLVTINYRTGVLGFLSLEDPTLDVPGNAGLKDMVLALKWVQQNIKQFGGDPNNVTIFGESAGAVSVHCLILSPMAKGLFHKAILQSGCALNVWASGRKCATDLAQVLALETTDERKILVALQNLPVDELFQAAEKLIPEGFIANYRRPYGPVIENRSKDAFLCENPLDIIKSGQYNHVPIMIGYTTREGIIAEIMQKPKPFRPLTDFELAVPNFLKIQQGSDISKMLAKQIKEFYYGNEEPTVENKDIYFLLETDNFFVREMLRIVKYHVETSPAPVYLYRMSIETSLNMVKNIYEITNAGVCHGDDLGYLFKNLLTPEIEPGTDEEIAVKRFVKLWTNFARFGNPIPKREAPLLDVEWKPVTKHCLNFLDIGKNLTTGVNPEADRMEFWDKILNVNPICKL